MDKGIFCEEMAFFLDELVGFLPTGDSKLRQESFWIKISFFVVFLSHFSIVGKMVIGWEICWSELVQFSEGFGHSLADFFWFLEKVGGI